MFIKEGQNSQKDSTKQWKSQLSIGLTLFAVLFCCGLYICTISTTLCIYYFTGLAFGFVLQKSRFFFTASMRDPYLTGSTALTKAVLVAIALTSIGFTIIKYIAFSNGQTIPGQDYVLPITLATIIGGLLFGIGMVIASGCASGTLMRIGEGFQVHLITLLFFIIGSVWGAHDIEYWNKHLIFSQEGIFLPDIVGWLPALIIQLSLILFLYVLAHKWGEKSE